MGLNLRVKACILPMLFVVDVDVDVDSCWVLCLLLKNILVPPQVVLACCCLLSSLNANSFNVVFGCVVILILLF